VIGGALTACAGAARSIRHRLCRHRRRCRVLLLLLLLLPWRSGWQLLLLLRQMLHRRSYLELPHLLMAPDGNNKQ
jgi:hypothetical protein